MTDDTQAPKKRLVTDGEPTVAIDEILQTLSIPNNDPDIEASIAALEQEWAAQDVADLEDQWAAQDAEIEIIIPDEQLPDFEHYRDMRDAGEFAGTYGDWQNFEAPRQGPKEPSWTDKITEEQAIAASKPYNDR